MLKSGDVAYYGGMNVGGVVAAFSGVEPYFDILISNMVAHNIHAFSMHAKEKHFRAYPKEHFIP